jgi:Fic family protein
MKMPHCPRSLEQLLREKGTAITELAKDTVSYQLVKRYNEEYIPWDELRRKELKDDPEAIWGLMKLLRSSQYKHITLDDLTLSYNTTNTSQQILHMLDTGASGFLAVPDEPIKKQKMERYVISSLMEEAIASSQIEGAVTTTKVAKRMLRERRKPRSHSEQMILNDYLTMHRIKEVKDRPLSIDLILELHKLIAHDSLDDPADEGRFRTDDEIVVADILETDKIFHAPPIYQKIPNYMKSLCSFVNGEQEGGFLHPLVKAIIVHFIIGYVHPFVDGNGRLARALMYWYALKNNYWLFEYMAVSKVIKESRGKYGAAYLYAETDENDVTYFVNYNLECMKKALDNTRLYIMRKQKEQQEAIYLVENHPELNFRQAEILKNVIKHRGELITVNEIASKFNVARQTARTDLLLLHKQGFLEMKRIGERKIVYKYQDRKNGGYFEKDG